MMRNRFMLLLGSVGLVAWSPPLLADDRSPSTAAAAAWKSDSYATQGAWWDGLDLRNSDGARIPITERWVVLAFLDPECPVANACLPVLNALFRSFRGKGVQVIGVYTDSALTSERLHQHGREFAIEFPVVQDRDHRLLRLSGATYSSEVAVCDARGTVLYRGRIDNRVGEDGAARPKATEHDLAAVLERLHAGETGPFPSRPGFGCYLPGARSSP
jgi:hypothetical protein